MSNLFDPQNGFEFKDTPAVARLLYEENLLEIVYPQRKHPDDKLRRVQEVNN